MQLNDLEQFLIKCGGGDIETLNEDKVPVEYNKLVGIGGSVLLTAIYSAFAMAFASSWIFNDKLVIFLICIFWGLAIFNLDRFIVSTTYKKNIFQISDLLQLLFRGALTVMIALTISIPLEIKFFEKELLQWIDESRKSEVYNNTELQRLQNEKDSRWNEYKDEIDTGSGGRRLNTVGPVSEKYYQDFKTAESKYENNA